MLKRAIANFAAPNLAFLARIVKRKLKKIPYRPHLIDACLFKAGPDHRALITPISTSSTCLLRQKALGQPGDFVVVGPSRDEAQVDGLNLVGEAGASGRLGDEQGAAGVVGGWGWFAKACVGAGQLGYVPGGPLAAEGCWVEAAHAALE